MPIASKGARLYLRRGDGKSPGTWIIRDGSKSVRTGFLAAQRGEAEKRLAEYIVGKHRPSRKRGRHPSEIDVADVLSIYLADKATKTARPHEVAQRITALADSFGRKKLDDINGDLCRKYAAERGSISMARRELEDLRAAINYHRREGLCDAIVEVVIPEKAQPRDRWLTRAEAAELIWAAWRYREVQKGQPTGRRSRQHIARFILVGLYTGTRAAAICGASLSPAIGRGHVNLRDGIFTRLGKGKRATKKKQPSIQLPSRLLAHMRRWQARGLSNHAVVEWQGAPIQRVTKAFGRAVADAGLDREVTPHTLRHTAVTWAMQNGADLWEAAGYFGMTVEVLERVYGHHRPGAGASVARAIQAKKAG